MQNFDESYNSIPMMFDERLKQLEATLTDRTVTDLDKGRAIKTFLDEGYSPSLRKLLDELHEVGRDTVARLHSLAHISPAALACFNQKSIRAKWAWKLKLALERNPDFYLSKVAELKTADLSDFKKFKVLAALA